MQSKHRFSEAAESHNHSAPPVVWFYWGCAKNPPMPDGWAMGESDPDRAWAGTNILSWILNEFSDPTFAR
jgi:hypothetical protein